MGFPLVRDLESGGWCRDGLPKPYKLVAQVSSFASRIVMHPRSPEAHSVFGTGALLLCQPSEMVRVGVAPTTSSFRIPQGGTADITP